MKGYDSPRTSQFEKNSTTPTKYDLDNPRKPRFCSPKAIGTSLIAVGALLVVLSIVYSTVLPKVIDHTIKSGVATCTAKKAAKETYLDPNGDCKDCTPYYYNLYLFNITNAEDYLVTNAKLQLQELGPYVYRKRQIKLNVTFENGRVNYKQYSYYTFQADMSCSGCSDQDNVVSYDTGYMSVISQSGGEYAFLTALAKGTFAKTLAADALATLIEENAPQMMRWVNGLNSLDAEAMKAVSSGSAVLKFLATGPTAIQNLTMSGFAYNGLFAKRTVTQWAMGYPSILAGLGLGSNYVGACTKGGIEAKCASCTGSDCYSLFAQCKKCASGKSVVAMNEVNCGKIEQIYADAYGASEAKTFAAGTCGLCSSVGLCAAPLPGVADTSGLDYSKSAPAADTLKMNIQVTGCNDLSQIGQYEQYRGVTVAPIWAKLQSRRNPTLDEIAAFSKYGNCDNPTANLTCSKVQGGDGQSIKPGGVGIGGFVDEIPQKTISLYIDQVKRNISVVSVDTEIDYEGISLHRFIAPSDLLMYTEAGADKGTGIPVDGVQSLAFTSGFLAYLSYPVFLYGDSSLTSSVDIKMTDGVVVSKDSMYDADGSVKTTYADKYLTYVDIEAGTGKTMRAKKRLQASYAVAKSSVNASRPMTDVLWPNLMPEVITPVYWGEEGGTISDKKVDQFNSIKSLLSSLIPVLIAGIIVGVLVAAFGAYKRHRAIRFAEAKARSSVI